MSSASSETTTSPDPVLTAERAHLARSADCLTEMRAAAHAVTDAGVDAWASERLGAARAERLRHLAADPGVPPFFGRTDSGTETFHIGRRHVRDAAGDPVVIDWRAPMSRPFYQASAVQPQGGVISAAAIPTHANSTGRATKLVLGFLLGLILGVGTAALLA